MKLEKINVVRFDKPEDIIGVYLGNKDWETVHGTSSNGESIIWSREEFLVTMYTHKIWGFSNVPLKKILVWFEDDCSLSVLLRFLGCEYARIAQEHVEIDQTDQKLAVNHLCDLVGDITVIAVGMVEKLSEKRIKELAN